MTINGGVSLTEKDIGILLMIYRYGGCAISHLYERFWLVTLKRFGPRTSCYRRLHQLNGAGYLHGHRLPSLTGLGAGRLFLTLGPKGRGVLAEHLGLSRSDLQRLRHIETPFIGAHHLAICDFRLSLELGCEASSSLELVEWISERELRATPVLKVKDPRAPHEIIPLIWDGEFCLRFGGASEASLRLEMDMGTIAAKRIRARLRAYLAHASVDERPVLWVVPDANRLQVLNKWASEEAEALSADPTIFWLTTKEHTDPTRVLGPIWQVVGGPTVGLLPAAPAVTTLIARSGGGTSGGGP